MVFTKRKLSGFSAMATASMRGFTNSRGLTIGWLIASPLESGAALRSLLRIVVLFSCPMAQSENLMFFRRNRLLPCGLLALFVLALSSFVGTIALADEKTLLISETSVGGGLSETIAKEGNTVYIARHADGVEVMDVSNPANPVTIAVIDPDGPTFNTVNVWDVQVLNGVLFVFNKGLAEDPNPDKGNWTGVYMYDVTLPWDPVEVGAIVWGKHPGHHLGAWTESGEVGLIDGVPHLFVCSKITTMVEVFDVSDPAVAVWKSSVMRPAWKASQETVYQDGLLYTAWGTEGFTIDDLSDPANPVRLGHQPYLGPAVVNGGLRTLCPTPDGNHLITGEYTNAGDVRLWNITNPSAITQVSSWRLGTNSLLWSVKATNDYAYVAHLEDGIRILDIRTRTSLTPAGFFDPDPAASVRTWAGIADIVIDGMTLYASHETRGLFVVEHDPLLPPPDDVTITLATYKTSKNELKVYATSSLQPTPTLTVAGLGVMTWKPRNSRYELTVRLPTAPTNVTVQSSARGVATRSVTVTR